MKTIRQTGGVRRVRRAILTAALAILAGIFAIDPSARAQAPTSVHALTGQPAPGAPPGFTWSGFLGAVIADDGEMIFTANMQNASGGTGGMGIWRGTPGNFSLVARTETPAPGAGTGATFTEFGFLPSRGSDRTTKPLVFTARVTVGGNNVNSIWVVPNVAAGALVKVVMEGDPASGGGTVQFINSLEVPCAFDGSFAFAAVANDQPSIFVFRNGAPAELLARSFAPAAGLSQGTYNLGSNPVPVMGDDATTALRALINDGPTLNGDRISSVLYDTSAGQLQPRIRAGDSTETSGVLFGFFGEPSLAPDNTLGFYADLRDAEGQDTVDLSNNAAICLGTRIVARKGDPVPSSPAGEILQHFDTKVVANNESVLFGASFLLDNNFSRTGLCLGFRALGSPEKVAYEGDHPPGTPDDVEFAAFGQAGGTGFSLHRAQINSAGQVVFAAIIEGASVEPGRNYGLWASLPDDTLLLVAREGGEIEIAPGSLRRITDITFMGGIGASAGPGDGYPSALNDAGQVVFVAVFDDGRAGIVTASLGSPAAGSTSANFKQSITAADPVNTRAGELIDSAVDLNLGGPMPLQFSRYYASRLGTDRKITGALGPNWVSNFDAKLTIDGNTAEAVTNEGRVISFEKSNNTWTLIAPLDIPYQLVQSGAAFALGDPRTQQLWTFDANGRLMKMEDGRGNSHTLTYDGDSRLASVSDGLGRSLNLAYDAGGRLVRVGDGTRIVQYGYDANGALASVTDPLNRVTTYAYDAGALLTGATLPRGNTPRTQTFAEKKVTTQAAPSPGGPALTQFAYDSAARTTTITDPTNANRVHTYTATGELSGFTDEANETISIASDAAGRRSAVTDRLGRTTTIMYHAASGKPASITTPDGARTSFEYTSRVVAGVTLFDLTEVTFPDGTSRNFAYDASGNLTRATDPLGSVSQFTYNNRGQLLIATNPLGGVTTYSYDAAGNLVTSKDSDTAETSYAYDGVSRLTRATFADGSQLDFSYDAGDRLTSMTDQRRQTYSFSYDENDNLSAISDPANATARFSYDPLDRITQLTNKLGKTRSRTFDPRDLLASETDELNHVTTIGHDSRQRVTTVTEPGGATTTFVYDDEGELISVTDPLSHTISLTRNQVGRIVSVSDALGGTVGLERDALQRVTRIIDPLGRTNTLTYNSRGQLVGASVNGVGTTNYQRDMNGNLTRIIDANGNPWNFSYTGAGRLAASVDPLGKITTLAYDTRGRLANVILPEGGSASIERDGAGLVTRVVFTDGTDLQFGYDPLGRLIAANGIALTRDAEGQITNSRQAGADYTATYDDAGRPITVGYHNGAIVVSYSYDVNDRLTTVTDNLSGASVTFTYDAVGNVTSVVRSNGVNSTLTYDAAARLTRIQEGAILDLKYILNAAGDILSADITAPLVPAVTPEAKEFTYNAAGEVSASGYSYDARGRLTASPGHISTWDGASRLKSIDGTTLNYDGFGDVTTRTLADATTRFFFHHAIAGHPLVGERNEASNQFTRYYVWTPTGTLLYAIDATSNAPSFYHYDRVGSTLAITDSTGAVTDAYAYSPYGEPLGHIGTSTQPFTFAGAFGVRREGPVYQMRARYYDPLTARFLSRDPAGPRLADPRTLDPYLYALGNPLRYVDRDGAEPEGIPGSAYGAGAQAVSLFGGVPSENVTAREALGAATAFGNKNQIVGIALGILFADPEPETFTDTNVAQPILSSGEVFNAELNRIIERSREMELEQAELQLTAERVAVLEAATALERSESNSKSQELIQDALEQTGLGTTSSGPAAELVSAPGAGFYFPNSARRGGGGTFGINLPGFEYGNQALQKFGAKVTKIINSKKPGKTIQNMNKKAAEKALKNKNKAENEKAFKPGSDTEDEDALDLGGKK